MTASGNNGNKILGKYLSRARTPSPDRLFEPKPGEYEAIFLQALADHQLELKQQLLERQIAEMQAKIEIHERDQADEKKSGAKKVQSKSAPK